MKKSRLFVLSALISTAMCAGCGGGSNISPSLTYAQKSKDGIATLQSFYSQSDGLYQTSWWTSANELTTTIDYMQVTGDTQFEGDLANSLVSAPRTNPGFLDGYYDDEGWWALAWIDAYDLTQDPKYLTAATSIFTDMTTGWDNDTCGGGIWWDKAHSSKNAIANELFLSVAAHLYNRVTDPAQKATILVWANKEWTWFSQSGMINSQNLINDGLNLSTCKNNGDVTWSYNQGVILGGLVEYNKAAPNTTLITTAQAIASATLTNLTDAQGVLHDKATEPAFGGGGGTDGQQFKGVFMRNLMALNNAYPDPSYAKFFDTNADSIWSNSQGPGYTFGQDWSGPVDVHVTSMMQGSALDAIIAAASAQSSTTGN
jgi:predicted alpha-1,6-mannanase (GH76 family)